MGIRMDVHDIKRICRPGAEHFPNPVDRHVRRAAESDFDAGIYFLHRPAGVLQNLGVNGRIRARKEIVDILLVPDFDNRPMLIPKVSDKLRNMRTIPFHVLWRRIDLLVVSPENRQDRHATTLKLAKRRIMAFKVIRPIIADKPSCSHVDSHVPDSGDFHGIHLRLTQKRLIPRRRQVRRRAIDRQFCSCGMRKNRRQQERDTQIHTDSLQKRLNGKSMQIRLGGLSPSLRPKADGC